MNCMFRLKKLPKLYNCISAEAVFIFEILKEVKFMVIKILFFTKDTGTTYIYSIDQQKSYLNTMIQKVN